MTDTRRAMLQAFDSYLKAKRAQDERRKQTALTACIALTRQWAREGKA